MSAWWFCTEEKVKIETWGNVVERNSDFIWKNGLMNGHSINYNLTGELRNGVIWKEKMGHGKRCHK